MTVKRASGGWFGRYGGGALLVGVAAVFTTLAVRHWHTPGQVDVITAQAMDMSEMRPPAGAAPVQLAGIKRGSLGAVVTYSGAVQAFDTQDISPRIAGQVVALPVYPGQSVRAGQVVAQLDSAEVGAKVEEQAAEARGAAVNERIAELNHHQHHRAALEQASAAAQATEADVAEARAQARAAADAIADAESAQRSAQAGADYWKTEIAREKTLADAGAASRQEYQQEQSQAAAAADALDAAAAKVAQAREMAAAAQAKMRSAERNRDAANAMTKMATADLALAQEQTAVASATADAARAGARAASVVAGYARIVAPRNGVVSERPVSPGTLVQPGTVLLRIEEIDRVRVQAQVASADLAGITVGTPVEIAVQGAGGAGIAAKVTSVFPAADATTHTAVVESVVANPEHRLLPGAFVTMRLRKPAADSGGWIVPAAALVYSGGKASVWVASGAAGWTVHSAPVTAGASDGTLTEVTGAPLAAGDRVVVRGQAGLTDGMAVAEVKDWGADGPATLPTAGQAARGSTRYRCEICGMTYSAADAARRHFIDPMDGGKLVPVQGGSK